MMYWEYAHGRVPRSSDGEHNRTALQCYARELLSPGNRFVSDVVEQTSRVRRDGARLPSDPKRDFGENLQPADHFRPGKKGRRSAAQGKLA
jgi:hypothetical protein